MDERENDERQGLPQTLKTDIAALAAVMAEHGLAKMQIEANGIRVVLTATSAATNGVAASGGGVQEDGVAPASERPSGYDVPAPMIGTFYTAPSPGQEAYVRVGDLVSPGQTLCIIEAMKINNEIQAERGGIVEEIYVSNGQPVEYNQPLMRLSLG